MKNNNKIFYALFIMLITITSCDDLERFPTSVIERSQAFQTIEDARAWNAGLYVSLKGNMYGSAQFTPDVQADQLNATLTYGNRNGAPHRWTEFLADNGALTGLWGTAYRAIANTNIIINNYPNISLEDAADKAELDEYLGNAHLARAFHYHSLVVRYGKTYNPSTAATDLGVPIFTNFDVSVKQPRSTIAEVYELILDDIAIAKSKLASVGGASGSIEFNIDVVTALEARVKFYMKQYSEAKTLADKLINSGKYPLHNTLAGLRSMWYNDDQQEIIMSLFTSSPNELSNTNNIYLGYTPATDDFSPDFIPSQWVVDMYEDDDYRKQTYFNKVNVRQEGVVYPNIWVVNKYPNNPDLLQASNTYQHAPIVFRVGEMYMISAESATKMPGSDALTPLNAIRVARNLPQLSGIAGTALFEAIKDERFRELAFEGFRLDDLRRWELGFTRRDPQDLRLINVGADFNTLSITAGADKFTWGIPQQEISSNTAMKGQQNPGW